MKILMLGAGVIGITYAWQLSNAGHAVTLFVREAKLERIREEGVRIRCEDERQKEAPAMEVTYRPSAVDELRAQDNYDLIIVSVRAHQLEDVLPMLGEHSGKADVLFFCNNWWGEEKIRKFLPPEKYFFGFSRLVGGWRTENQVDSIIFDNPELVTMLGERNGRITARLQNLREIFEKANLKPVLSEDILGWLAIHYVEFLGVIGGILKAGSYNAFVGSSELIKESILATRESLDICKARGIDFKKAAPSNIRIVESTPIFLLTPLVKMQYKTPAIQQFFEENIAHGMQEIASQYKDVISEGKRLHVKMTTIEGYEKYYKTRVENKS
jgi:ketopantoate reductase